MGESIIPCFDFSGNVLNVAKNSESWKELTERVRDACENYGCFLVKFDGSEPRQRFFTALKTLFDLREETLKKYNGDNPKTLFNCYKRTSYQHFSIDEAGRLDIARDFTTLMWPNDDHKAASFCEAMTSMSSKMLEMTLIILQVLLKSFDMANAFALFEKNSMNHFRMMKYEDPTSDDANSNVRLGPHTDKSFLSILCDNGVRGLEVQSKEDGKWSKIVVPDQSFIVVIGDCFKAWSNRKFHSVLHRVIKGVGETRYSCALFLTPRVDGTIEVSQEFVDEDHPACYRPFTYSDFLKFYVDSNYIDGSLDCFAGI